VYQDGPSVRQSQELSQSTCSGVNGNINGSKATYYEGDSVPYQIVMTGSPGGAVTGLRSSGPRQWGNPAKHALDYLTSYKRTIGGAELCTGTGANCANPRPVAIPSERHLTAAEVVSWELRSQASCLQSMAPLLPLRLGTRRPDPYTSASSTSITVSFHCG